MKKLFWLAVIIIINFLLQFLAWSYAPGQNLIKAKLSSLQKVGWSVLSFPTFWIASEKIVNEYFMILLIINSLLWSVVIYAVLSLFVNMRR